mmetsp:Transcript_27899/g.61199  ORF Transcript_27899/g.61199 Transcript_27899/m.61199 type:complete len:194 (+) Transcript_27899:170-751(+)|eukprot:CAMPEP_0202891468 /NCGR_PEP_ID=MMETSP1392-20130828/1510_1 /ASSEMBLY_ACC=CAM_ASM_000868 /TAXON_ID=225041 /ORGANISM="Chlamydomonas chlamydogama, Strain SAG 11-48b" /LENGTH=193 /DNA_ID=CAMNT_0049575221 /DNA_START=109 /DNA_END=690 /DNA_ORIENTATION=+
MALSLGKVLGIVLNVSLWAAWIIYLAGVGKVTDDCVTDKYVLTAGRKLLGNTTDCGITYSLSWWSVWLQFMCQLLALFMLFGLRPFATSFVSTANSFFIMSTVLLFQIANLNVVTAHFASGAATDVLNATRTTAAGAVALLIFNFLWIIFHTSTVSALHSHAPSSGSSSSSSAEAPHDVATKQAAPAPADNKV